MILAAHTQRDIRNAALSALYGIAHQYHCDLSDVVAAIKPRDSAHQLQKAAGGTIPTDQSGARAEGLPEIGRNPEPTNSPEQAPENAVATLQAGEAIPSTSPAPNQDQPLPQQAPLPADPAPEPPHTGTGIAGEVTPASASPALRRGRPKAGTITLLSLVEAHMKANPGHTVRDCADALGTTTEKVRNSAAGIVTFAPMKRGPGGPRAKPAETRKPVPAPEVQPEPEPRPAPAPEARPSPFAPVGEDQPRPVIRRPKGKRFRLRDMETGLYLHQDLSQSTEELHLTALRQYPWIGSADQLDAVRRKFPATHALHPVEVEKEPAR